ncbi:MAG: cytochrome c oxidase subunit I [Ilumatobacteraceae bacterium]
MTIETPVRDAGPPEAPEPEHVWEDRPGWLGFFTTVDHKKIGIRYIVTAFTFFFIAGLMALVMRAQLAQPDSDVVSPETFNQLFTMHGTLMIFLFNTPVLFGFGNYIMPLLLGARDMAFPRLNAFGYWVFLGSGIFMLGSFLFGKAPDGGWFAYVPLTDKDFSPGLNLDFWGLGVIFTGISTTTGAINFIASAFKLRAPGMTVNRIPLVVWAFVSMAFMVIFAVPSLTVAAALLEADRLFGTAFYRPGAGGNVLLYQHLFWFWGHPEVYILFLPATGMVTTMITVFSRRPTAGYLWIASSFVGIAFISFGVWVHHMFATGMPTQATGLFAAASFIVSVPSGIMYMAWIGTMWGGRVRFTVPMLFALGFLIIFLLGGITGVMVASLGFDLQVHDTYFVVAHFHYVLNGAVVFPIFGALYFWIPKMTGRMLSERLGKWSFWTMLIGFNVTFFPMHILGQRGMVRRIYTYREGLGWDTLNMVVSIGSVVFAVGTGLTLLNIVISRRRGAIAGPNPWDADTLEWATSSPPPEFNFEASPVVNSRHPLWDQQPLPYARDVDLQPERAQGPRGAVRHEMAVTTGFDAKGDGHLPVPDDSPVPAVVGLGLFILFVGVLLVGAVFFWSGVVVGVGALTVWAWRTEMDKP